MFILRCIVEGAVYGSRLIGSRVSNWRTRKLKLGQIERDRPSKEKHRLKNKIDKYRRTKGNNQNGIKKSVSVNITKKKCEVSESLAFGLGIYAFLSVMKRYGGFYGYGVRYLEQEYSHSLLQVTDDDKKIASKHNKIMEEIHWG